MIIKEDRVQMDSCFHSKINQHVINGLRSNTK